MDKAKYIWMNGKFVNWDDANVHVLSHTLHYGNGVIEGTKAYKTAKGYAIFRLNDHTKRLKESAKMTLMGYLALSKSTNCVAVARLLVPSVPPG